MQQSYVEILWSSTLPRINFLLPWRVWPSRSSRLVKRHWAELFFDVQRSHLLLQVLYFCFFFIGCCVFFWIWGRHVWDQSQFGMRHVWRRTRSIAVWNLGPWNEPWNHEMNLDLRNPCVFVSPRNCIFKSSWRAKIWMCLDSSGNNAPFLGERNRRQVELAIGALTAGVKECTIKGTLVVRLEAYLHFGCSCSILFGWDKCGITFTTFPHLSTHDGFSGKCWVIWGSFTGSFSYSWWSLGLKSYSLLHFNVWGYERRSSKEGMEVWNGNCSSNSLWS